MGFKHTFAAGLIGVSTLSLTDCTKPGILAPDEPGTCFHIGYPANGKPRFNVVKRNVKAIEYCAAALDELRMQISRAGMPKNSIDGAYGGSFIFIQGRYIRVSKDYDGASYLLMVRTDDGRLVAPGTIVVDDEFGGDRGQSQVRSPASTPDKP